MLKNCCGKSGSYRERGIEGKSKINYLVCFDGLCPRCKVFSDYVYRDKGPKNICWAFGLVEEA